MKHLLSPSLPKSQTLTFWLSWLIICAIGVSLRLFPLLHHASDEAKEKASLLVMTQIKQSVEEAVSTSFPQLPPAEKNLLIKKKFDELLRQEKKQVHKTIAQLSADIQKKLPTPDRFYLLASDSFYYLGLTQNILRTGSVSTRVQGSKYFNPKMAAPRGHWEPLNLHPYLGAMLHAGIARFFPDITLMASVSYTPLIIMCLSVLPFLWICRLWGYSFLVTLTSASFLITAQIFLKRSMYGWYDNDPYSILFPLTILALILTGLRKIQQHKPWGTIAIASGFTVSLYALFWQGWVFMGSLIMAGGIADGLYVLFYKKEKSAARHIISFYATAFMLSFAGVSVLFGWQEFFTLFKEGLKALHDFGNPSFSFWPDLYLAVGELKKATFPLIIEL
ncbi:MAG: STT3 domain-containing protein, partial [Candidatus Omnitrophota bacterium]